LPKKTLAIARSGGADVLVQVKENQPELLAMCQMLAQYQSPSQQHVDHDKGHGRIETRMIDTFIPPSEWLPEGWQPLVQAVVKVVRVIEHKRKGMAQTSEETAWWVSTVVLSAEQFQGAIRGHWSVENQNHHVRDVVMFEDACRTRAQPGILARLRSIALNCMRASNEPCISRAIYRNTLNFDHAVSVAHRRT
jgi:predicted transposase YbfD/YdcC